MTIMLELDFHPDACLELEKLIRPFSTQLQGALELCCTIYVLISIVRACAEPCSITKRFRPSFRSELLHLETSSPLSKVH